MTALEDVGLRPQNPIERAAFDKMVAELLDRITSYGFLSFAELRDTISRNQFKLADLSEPEDFLRGDPLIRLDRRLGSLLDGVYRPSEFYTRWLERGTSVLFGTSWGRVLSRYLLLPLLSAWMTLHIIGLVLESFFPYPDYPHVRMVGQTVMGPLHNSVPKLTYKEVVDFVTWPAAPNVVQLAPVELAPLSAAAVRLLPPDPPWFCHVGLLVPLTIFFLVLFHSSGLRRLCRNAIHAVGRGLRFVIWRVPMKFVPLDYLRQIVSTWVFRLLWWYLLKPALVWAVFALLYSGLHESIWAGAAVFVAALFLLNSRVGRAVSESVQDAFVNLATMVCAGLIPGLFRFTVQVFKQIVEFIEYVLFIVDEWLRFRSGGSQTSLVMRTILGVIWYPIAFLARFYMVVLIEPMVNPLKLPISILAAKIVYPALATSGLFEVISWREYSSPLVVILQPYLTFWVAWVIVIGTFWLLPDAFAFLAWELKENWNLYRANRSKVLKPVVIGAHGETLRGLLEPGFHSGTIPRLFVRLRRAERQATQTRNWHNVRAPTSMRSRRLRRPCAISPPARWWRCSTRAVACEAGWSWSVKSIWQPIESASS